MRRGYHAWTSRADHAEYTLARVHRQAAAPTHAPNPAGHCRLLPTSMSIKPARTTLESHGSLGVRPALLRASGHVATSIFGGLALLGANILLASQLGPTEFGRLRLVIALASVGALIADLGTSHTLIRHLPILPANAGAGLLRRALALRLASFGVLAIGLLIARSQLALNLLGDPLLAPYFVLGALFVGSLYFDILPNALLGIGRYRLFLLSSGGALASSAVLAVAFGHAGGAQGALLGWSLGPILGALPGLVLVPLLSQRSGSDAPTPPALTRYGLPMLLEQLLRNADALALPLASGFLDGAELGRLAFVLLFYRTLMQLATRFSLVMIPSFAQLEPGSRSARSFRRSVVLAVTPVVLCGVSCILLLAGPAISLVDSRYLAAADAFKIIVSYGVAGILVSILGAYLSGVGDVRRAIWVAGLQQLCFAALLWLSLATL